MPLDGFGVGVGVGVGFVTALLGLPYTWRYCPSVLGIAFRFWRMLDGNCTLDPGRSQTLSIVVCSVRGTRAALLGVIDSMRRDS